MLCEPGLIAKRRANEGGIYLEARPRAEDARADRGLLREQTRLLARYDAAKSTTASAAHFANGPDRESSNLDRPT
jgi:hypothetical protein